MPADSGWTDSFGKQQVEIISWPCQHCVAAFQSKKGLGSVKRGLLRNFKGPLKIQRIIIFLIRASYILRKRYP